MKKSQIKKFIGRFFIPTMIVRTGEKVGEYIFFAFYSIRKKNVFIHYQPIHLRHPAVITNLIK